VALFLYEPQINIVNSIAVPNSATRLSINTVGTVNNLLDSSRKYFMSGSWIKGFIPITAARQLPNGNVVYFANAGDGFLRMVTNTGEARYYPTTADANLAKVENFDANKWATYASAGTNQLLNICNLQCTSLGCSPDGTCIVQNPVVANTVEIARNDGKPEFINLTEIEAYTRDSAGKEVKVVFTNGLITPKYLNGTKEPYPWQNLIDGKFDTIATSAADKSASISLSVPVAVPIYRVMVYNRTTCCGDRINGCVLRLKNGSNVVWQANFSAPTQAKYEFITTK
jgi:hypothetical protein